MKQPEDGERMTSAEAANLDLIHAYLNALQDGEAGDALRRFFTEDVRQVELPNQLNSRGQESDLASILRRSEQGLKFLAKQEFGIVSEMARGDCAAVEARWRGVLAAPLGKLKAGAEMRALFAMFFEFRGGRICLQRNYDCFEPW
jgi:ketosteroid isomerase-like protein